MSRRVDAEAVFVLQRSHPQQYGSAGLDGLIKVVCADLRVCRSGGVAVSPGVDNVLVGYRKRPAVCAKHVAHIRLDVETLAEPGDSSALLNAGVAGTRRRREDRGLSRACVAILPVEVE